MKIQEQYKGKEATDIWKTVTEYVVLHETITTVTGNVKPYIRRQQTPFIALLHCAGIIA